MTPTLRNVVLDTFEPRPLAEFYRQLLGWTYRPGDEDTDPAGDDWLVLRAPLGAGLAFQKVENYQAPTWPEGPRGQQLHLDMTVSDVAALTEQKQRVLDLGGTVLHDRFDDPEEPLYVFADPHGHPFCIFVG